MRAVRIVGRLVLVPAILVGMCGLGVWLTFLVDALFHGRWLWAVLAVVGCALGVYTLRLAIYFLFGREPPPLPMD